MRLPACRVRRPCRARRGQRRQQPDRGLCPGARASRPAMPARAGVPRPRSARAACRGRPAVSAAGSMCTRMVHACRARVAGGVTRAVSPRTGRAHVSPGMRGFSADRDAGLRTPASPLHPIGADRERLAPGRCAFLSRGTQIVGQVPDFVITVNWYALCNAAGVPAPGRRAGSTADAHASGPGGGHAGTSRHRRGVHGPPRARIERVQP